MGGKALASVGAIPMDVTTYKRVSAEVMVRIQKQFGEARAFTILPSYFSKDTFGDVDIICHSITPADVELIKTALKPASGVCPFEINGDVLSILYDKKYQIDFIMCTVDTFQMSYFLYSFNGFGVLMSRLFKRFNLKLNKYGLYMVLGESDNPSNRLILSKNPRTICESVGVSYDALQYEMGSIPAMYEHLLASPYCLPHLLKADTPERLKKQEGKPVLEQYAAYIESPPNGSNFYKARFLGDISREEFLGPVLRHFGAESKYFSKLKQIQSAKKITSRNLATRISQWITESGKDLTPAQVMEFHTYFKVSYPDLKALTQKDETAIKAEVLNALEQWTSIQKAFTAAKIPEPAVAVGPQNLAV